VVNNPKKKDKSRLTLFWKKKKMLVKKNVTCCIGSQVSEQKKRVTWHLIYNVCSRASA